jgi:hypothetical protein
VLDAEVRHAHVERPLERGRIGVIVAHVGALRRGIAGDENDGILRRASFVQANARSS